MEILQERLWSLAEDSLNEHSEPIEELEDDHLLGKRKRRTQARGNIPAVSVPQAPVIILGDDTASVGGSDDEFSVVPAGFHPMVKKMPRMVVVSMQCLDDRRIVRYQRNMLVTIRSDVLIGALNATLDQDHTFALAGSIVKRARIFIGLDFLARGRKYKSFIGVYQPRVDEPCEFTFGTVDEAGNVDLLEDWEDDYVAFTQRFYSKNWHMAAFAEVKRYYRPLLVLK